MTDSKTLPQAFLVTEEQLTIIFQRHIGDIRELLNRVQISEGKEKFNSIITTVETVLGSDIYYRHDTICPLIVTEIIKDMRKQIENNKQEAERNIPQCTPIWNRGRQ